VVTRSQRQQLVRVADKLRGTPYDDSHAADGWKNLHQKPTAFDCSTFVCRVAMEVLGYDHLAADVGWHLDHLIEVDSPQPGDLVGYGRAAISGEATTRDVVWHVMFYAGVGAAIGACDTLRSSARSVRLDFARSSRTSMRIDHAALPDGTCGTEDQLAYVAPTGLDNGKRCVNPTLRQPGSPS